MSDGGLRHGEPGVILHGGMVPHELRRVAAVSHPDVEVRSQYIGAWASGFEIVETTSAGFRVRRQLDGALLPGVFRPEEVREVDRPSPHTRQAPSGAS